MRSTDSDLDQTHLRGEILGIMTFIYCYKPKLTMVYNKADFLILALLSSNAFGLLKPAEHFCAPTLQIQDIGASET